MAAVGLEFTQLLVRHDRALLRYIMAFVPRRDDAEEVLQRTVVALWEKFPGYDPDRPFLPWAQRFAYFEVLNFRRELARSRLIFSEQVLEALVETRARLDPQLEAQRNALHQCLQDLEPEGRALLQRRYCDSETIESLAEENGKTAKSLYRRLDRIREQIARCVRQRLVAETV